MKAGEDTGLVVQKTNIIKEFKGLGAMKDAEVKETRVVLRSKLDTVGNIVHDSVPVSNDEVEVCFYYKYETVFYLFQILYLVLIV